MHELSIANSILETVREEARQRPRARLSRLGMRVGEWSGVDPDALTFCFSALVNGSDLDGLSLEIERCPPRQHCADCDEVSVVAEYNWNCPACGSGATQPIGGQELEITYLELEEA